MNDRKDGLGVVLLALIACAIITWFVAGRVSVLAVRSEGNG